MDSKKLSPQNQNRLIVGLLAVGIASMPTLAHAQLFGTGDNFVNNLLAFLNGGFARSVAIIGVIILGLLAMTGRLDMKKAGGIIVGIILIFAAAAIVDGIAGAV